MSDLSIFIDESGIQEGRSDYYLVTYVMHDQKDQIDDCLARYSAVLAEKGLPDIPFHALPLMRGKDDYELLDLQARKKLLMQFAVFVRKLPIRYKTFVYRSREFDSAQKLSALIRRDLAFMLSDNLTFFQRFEHVKVYYDNGQVAVATALEDAFSYMLAKGALVQRPIGYRSFRLAQVADYLCAIELTAAKYSDHKETATDNKFYGSEKLFKANWLKQARRKLLK